MFPFFLLSYFFIRLLFRLLMIKFLCFEKRGGHFRRTGFIFFLFVCLFVTCFGGSEKQKSCDETRGKVRAQKAEGNCVVCDAYVSFCLFFVYFFNTSAACCTAFLLRKL